MVGGGYFSLLGLTSQRDLIDVTWYNSLASGSQANPHIIIDFIKADLSQQFSTIISPPVTDGIESNNTWVLAVLGSSSVPEPAVTMGLCTSLLGLAQFICGSVRRRLDNWAIWKRPVDRFHVEVFDLSRCPWLKKAAVNIRWGRAQPAVEPFAVSIKAARLSVGVSGASVQPELTTSCLWP